VFVQEEEFDFGQVTTLGTSEQLKLTIVNQSKISAQLLLDLREREEVKNKHYINIIITYI
jgi:hypothetical protein